MNIFETPELDKIVKVYSHIFNNIKLENKPTEEEEMSEINNVEEVTEEVVSVTEEVKTVTAEDKLKDLQETITGMSGEDILNLDSEKTAAIKDSIKNIVSNVFIEMRDKVVSKKNVILSVEGSIMDGARKAIEVIDGKAVFDDIVFIINENVDNISAVLGDKAVEDIKGKFTAMIPAEDADDNVKLLSKVKLENLINIHNGRKKTIEDSYIDAEEFGTFLQDHIDECIKLNSNTRSYTLFKNKIHTFLKKKVSGTKEAASWHAAYNGRYIGPAANVVHRSYDKNVDKNIVVDTSDLNYAISVVTIALFKFMVHKFNDNKLKDVQRKKIISGIFIDTPELEALKYASVKAVLDKFEMDYKDWRVANNITDELEEAHDDTVIVESSANTIPSVEDAKEAIAVLNETK